MFLIASGYSLTDNVLIDVWVFCYSTLTVTTVPKLVCYIFAEIFLLSDVCLAFGCNYVNSNTVD